MTDHNILDHNIKKDLRVMEDCMNNVDNVDDLIKFLQENRDDISGYICGFQMYDGIYSRWWSGLTHEILGMIEVYKHEYVNDKYNNNNNNNNKGE